MTWDSMRAGNIKLVRFTCDRCGTKDQMVGTTSSTMFRHARGWGMLRRKDKDGEFHAMDFCPPCKVIVWNEEKE